MTRTCFLELIMYRFTQPSPGEVEAYIRRAHSERSRVVYGFLCRIAAAFFRRLLHPVPPAKPA